MSESIINQEALKSIKLDYPRNPTNLVSLSESPIPTNPVKIILFCKMLVIRIKDILYSVI